MEDAAKKTVLSGKPHTCGVISWLMDGEFLRMRLPSGRTLAYHHPKITIEGKITFMAVNSTTNKYEVEETWGGKLVENATQAVARDIMVESMFRLIKHKIRILFTVHDELVAEAPIGTYQATDIVDIVREVPSWVTGCPINAECTKTMRYQK
jgi:DNA polymerase